MANKENLLVKWSVRSLKQVSGIRDYLLMKFAEKEVVDFFNLLATFEETVISFPKLYPEFSEKKKLHRAVLNKNLSVYYSIKSRNIFVVSVLDNRKDYSKLL